jgi:hypothetical protein
MRHGEALTNLWRGRMLLTSGQSDDGAPAQRLLERAGRTARECGYTAIERRATALLG